MKALIRRLVTLFDDRQNKVLKLCADDERLFTLVDNCDLYALSMILYVVTPCNNDFVIALINLNDRTDENKLSDHLVMTLMRFF